MNRPFLIALIILGIAAFAFVVVAALAILWRVHEFDPDFLRIDACLDRGGSWDYEARTCSPQGRDVSGIVSQRVAEKLTERFAENGEG